MDNLKEELKLAIEKQRKTVFDTYTEQLNGVDELTNVAQLYSYLVKVYHNRIEQREVGKSILKAGLENDFFKKSKIKTSPNEIIFSDGAYNVSFSSSRVVVIVVNSENPVSKPYAPRVISEMDLKLLRLIPEFIDNPKNNIKELSHLYYQSSYSKHLSRRRFLNFNLFKYYNTNKLKDGILLKRLEGYKQQNKESWNKYNKDYSSYCQFKDDLNNFVSELTDLQTFVKERWIIKVDLGSDSYDISER